MSIEAKVRRAGKGKRLVIENGAEAEVNEPLVELVKEAFVIRNQFLSGSDAPEHPERWWSERVLTVYLGQDGHSSNLEVEAKRPVADVEQVTAHPVFDLLHGGRLAAPTIDLRPAGDAGLDPMA